MGIQQSLRRAIIAGAFAPGYRLREIPLAEYFGVSTTPVREALRQLQAEGLVTFFPRRGAVVVAMSASEVRELYEIRTVLETHAVQQAAARALTVAELGRVRAIAQQQRDMAAAGQVPPAPVDADFHRELAALGGNAAMAGLIERATRQIETVLARRQSVVEDGLRTAAAAHLAILERVEAGDAAGARELMHEHLSSACEMVLASLND
ncbi:GntR family transcriptional regulator [Occultella aeris]|uniref:Putative HTH-type transcriptional regulator YdfH n=2 Tax=Occultella aeris TaxID=2761496 RepID=A0A7M4DFK0_9MICO|nr:putative HTH-type transcriptional regulator YdfH [Occultella aeris]